MAALVPVVVLLGGLAVAFSALGLGADGRAGPASIAAVVGVASVVAGVAALARR